METQRLQRQRQIRIRDSPNQLSMVNPVNHLSPKIAKRIAWSKQWSNPKLHWMLYDGPQQVQATHFKDYSKHIPTMKISRSVEQLKIYLEKELYFLKDVNRTTWPKLSNPMHFLSCFEGMLYSILWIIKTANKWILMRCLTLFLKASNLKKNLKQFFVDVMAYHYLSSFGKMRTSKNPTFWNFLYHVIQKSKNLYQLDVILK